MNTNYQMATIEEFLGDYQNYSVDKYFELLDKETIKRNKIVAQSMKKYLKSVNSNLLA